METKKENNEVSKKEDSTIHDYIKRITKPYFDKALKEKSPNHTMVENSNSKPKKSVTYSLYNPHNYRLYFLFTKKSYTPKKGMVGVWFGKFKNYGKEFTTLGEGVRVTIKKTKVEVINKLTEEEWFLINKAKAKEEIAAVINKIDDKCINALKKFIEIYGGETDFIILNKENKSNLLLSTKSDNKVMKEKFIDKIPLKETFETPIVKKVYKKRNVEFKQPLYAAQHLETSALHDFSPEIANELGGVKEAIKEMLKQDKIFYQQFTGMVTGNTEVMKTLVNLNKGFTDLNIRLSELKQPPTPPTHHISKELCKLMRLIKKPDDIFILKKKDKAKIKLLNKEEKKTLERYIFSL